MGVVHGWWQGAMGVVHGSDVYVRFKCTAARCLRTAPPDPHRRWDRSAAMKPHPLALPHQLRA